MQPNRLSPEESAEIAEKVRSGEYFRESRQIYDILVHDPMADRYLYILLTALAVSILTITVFAMQSLYPLQTDVPFIYSDNNIVEDVPRIQTLLDHEGEAPSEALLHFLAQNYVTFREEYDVNTFDRDRSGIQSQSSSEVFAEYEKAIDPHNPESPVVLYQRHSQRRITILSYRHLEGQDEVEIGFEASVENANEVKKSRWIANIAFRYNGLELDEKTDRVKPVSFIVTGYHVKPL